MSKRKLLVGLSTAGVVATGFGATGLAGAEVRTLAVTLQGGKVVQVSVDVPPGTPISQIPLPDLGAPVIQVSEAGAAPAGTTQSTTAPGETAPATPPAATGTATSPTPPATTPTPEGALSAHRGTDDSGGDGREAAKAAGDRDERERKRAARRAKTDGTKATRDDASGATTDEDADEPLEGTDVPERSAAGFAESVPGPAAVGVPNFFIDKFRIPPFLLPIYQAAG
ncbi:MAG: hypothetical protein AB7G37_12370, partial [Solirubrobacteraceae bacterium]